jgi:hypothetical protein
MRTCAALTCDDSASSANDPHKYSTSCAPLVPRLRRCRPLLFSFGPRRISRVVIIIGTLSLCDEPAPLVGRRGRVLCIRWPTRQILLSMPTMTVDAVAAGLGQPLSTSSRTSSAGEQDRGLGSCRPRRATKDSARVVDLDPLVSAGERWSLLNVLRLSADRRILVTQVLSPESFRSSRRCLPAPTHDDAVHGGSADRSQRQQPSRP